MQMDLQQVSVNCFNFLAFSQQRDALSCFTSHEKTVFFSNCADKFSIRTDCLLFFVSFCLLFLPIVKVDKLSPFKGERCELEGLFSFHFFFSHKLLNQSVPFV